MEEQVHQMVAPGLQAMEEEVESEAEHSEGSVRLVALGTSHRFSPEVIVQEISEWSGREEVIIVSYGKDVDMNELPLETVVVTHHHDQYWQSVPHYAGERGDGRGGFMLRK